MNRSLVICLMISVATAVAAASSALLAGWGWLAAFGVYSASGALSLVAATLAAQALPTAVRWDRAPQAPWTGSRGCVVDITTDLRQGRRAAASGRGAGGGMLVGQLVISMLAAALVALAAAMAGLGALGVTLAYAVAAPATLLLLATRIVRPFGI